VIQKSIITIILALLLVACSDSGVKNEIQLIGKITPINVDQLVAENKQLDEKEVNESITERIATSREYAFDSCGPVETYESLPFFDAFLDKFNSISLYDPPGKKDHIKELCFSEVENILIGIDHGDYCTFNTLFKYDVNEDVLTLADFDFSNKPGCQGSAQEFGKRKGSYIQLYGGDGDGGAFFKIDYRYYFDTNLVMIKRYCNNHIGGEEEFGLVADQCKEYKI